MVIISITPQSIKYLKKALWITILLPHAFNGYALPVKPQTVAGVIDVKTDQKSLLVKQSSSKAIINWQGFDIASDELVQFKQPDQHSVILNRVTGNNPSEIFGKLQANGQVFLVNANGITFSKGASVNVQGLVASTLDIKDDDFLQENYQFQGLGGKVINQGNIQANTIALLGSQVINQGWLIAKAEPTKKVSGLGSDRANVALLSGSKIKISFGSDELLAVDIEKGAYAALVENAQLIEADGGQVLLRAEAVNDLLGAAVNNSGIIQARGLTNTDGRILLLADMQSGTTTVSGRLDASATGNANGGFIETSAAKVTIKQEAVISTVAENGNNGAWLIDPNDIVIDNSGDAGTVSTSSIETALTLNSSVTLQTTTQGSAGGNGDIFVKEDIDWSTDGSVLQLMAENDLHIDANITATGKNSGVKLFTGLSYNTANNWDKGFTNAEFASSEHLQFSAGNKISLAGEDAIFQLDNRNYQVINGNNSGIAGLTALDELQNLDATNYNALGLDIDAAATVGWNGSQGFDPLGSAGKLKGFEGLNHIITDLVINRSSENDVGLFKWADDTDTAYLKNLHLQDGWIKGKGNVGSLLGSAHKLVLHNTSSSVDITASSNIAGGLLGTANDFLSIATSFTDMQINGKKFVGGLVGSAEKGADISDSYSLGNINANSGSGGIVGIGKGLTLTDVYSTGDIVGNSNVGGIIGKSDQYINGSIVTKSSLNKVYSTGDISGTGFRHGGIVGSAKNTDISQAFSSGNITGSNHSNGSYGGIAGVAEDGDITDVYFSGTVSGTYYGGGIVGLSRGNTITNAFVSGTVNTQAGTTFNGGAVIGRSVTNTLENVVFDAGIRTGAIGEDVGIATDLATTQGINSSAMKQSSNYTGFDFGSCGVGGTWCIVEGKTTPGLNALRSDIAVSFAAVGNHSNIYDANPFQVNIGAYTVDKGAWSIFDEGAGLQTNSKNVASYNGTDLNLTGLYSSQYNLDWSAVGSGLNITAKDLNVTAIGTNKEYDRTINATVSLASNKEAADDLSFNFDSTFSDINVAIGKNVSVTNISLSGVDASNYNLINTSAATSADIFAKNISATASVNDKTYDASTQTSGLVLSSLGVIGADDISFSANTSEFIDKNIAANKTVNVTGISLQGVDASNYNLLNTTANTTASITPLLLEEFNSGCIHSGFKGCSKQLALHKTSQDVDTLADQPTLKINVIDGGLQLTPTN